MCHTSLTKLDVQTNVVECGARRVESDKGATKSTRAILYYVRFFGSVVTSSDSMFKQGNLRDG